jgi:hypothetical protein
VVTSDQCPTCRDKAEVHHLKPNRTLAATVQSYKTVRSDILTYALSFSKEGHFDSSTTSLSTNKAHKRENDGVGVPVTRKVPHMSFHGKPKKYVKDAIEKLCLRSSVKPILDGDQDDLERFYRELVHQNNAQTDSTTPLSFDEVVKIVNKKEANRKKEAKKSAKTASTIEKVKNGEVCSYFLELSYN